MSDELVRLIYDSIASPSGSDELAVALAKPVDGTQALIILRQGLEVIEGGFFLPGGFQVPYLNYYAGIDPWAQRAPRVPLGAVVVGEELISDQELLGTEFYEDFARQQGTFRPMTVNFAMGGGRLLGLGVNRPKDAAPFGDRDRAWFADISRHVFQASRLKQRLRGSGNVEAAAQIGFSALDAIDFAAVVLGSDRVVLFANAAAQGLERLGTIRLANRQFSTPNPAGEQQLTNLVVNVTSGGPGGGARLVDPASGLVLLALVTPLASRWHETTRDTLVLVTLRMMNAQPNWTTSMLRNVFGLSQAESDIAQGLLNGASLETLASQRKTAIPTLRTQVRSLFRKVGVSSQQELVGMLAALPQVRL